MSQDIVTAFFLSPLDGQQSIGVGRDQRYSGGCHFIILRASGITVSTEPEYTTQEERNGKATVKDNRHRTP